MAARLLVLLVFATGCIDDSLVRCNGDACPLGNVCTVGGCAAPTDVTACEGLAEGADCHASSGGIGTCEGGACRTGLCGNGVVDVGEVCDDGNQVSGDGCRGDCKKIEMCGDGQLDANEQCDDGNVNPADGCDACKLTSWQISVVAGSEVGATMSALANPGGVAIDGQGRTFIADTNNHRILRVELDGSVTTVAGTGSPGYSGDGGGATSAQLAFPGGVAVDGLGRVFIADTANSCIRRIETDGTIETIVGNGSPGYTGDGGAAILAQVSAPNAVAVDGLGRVFIADTGNSVIRAIATDGTIATVAGNGTPGFSGDGADATAAELASPGGVAIDALGRAVIADTANQRVRRVEVDGTIDTLAGSDSPGFFGDGGPATDALLAFPSSVAVDAQGAIAIADFENQRVRRIDAAGTISTVAGNGTIGFSGDGGAAVSAAFSNPIGVAVDGQGRIAIADTANQRIRRVDAGGVVSTIAGDGAYGLGGASGQATSALLSNPFGLAIDGQGRIFIADTFDRRIQRVDTDGSITSVAGAGTSGYGGDGGPAVAAQLANPDFIAIDNQGRTVIADTYNDRVRRVELDGTIHTIAGTGIPGFFGDGGPATSAHLDFPNGVAVDAQDRVLIVDTYNHRVRRIETNGTITTIAGNGSFGYGGDGGPATSASLAYPYGVAVDALGRVLIGDTSNQRVRRVELDGTITTVAGSGVAGFFGDGGPATSAQLSSPYGVAVDAQGQIYIADCTNQRVRRIAADGTISTVAGTGVIGKSGDGGPAVAAQLSGPIDVKIDPQGRAVIADTNTNRIRRIELDGTITTVAGAIDPDGVGPVARGRLIDPQALVASTMYTFVAGGSSGTLEAIGGGTVTAAAGRYPQSIATGALARFRTQGFGEVGGVAVDDARGLVYITETTANRLHVITEVDPANPKTWTIAPLVNVAGDAGFGDGAAATAQLRAPRGLYLDPAAGVLYIADTGNHAIRALDVASGVVSTVVNTSHSLGFAGDGGPGTAALLYQPTAITRCGGGDMFIADTGNDRVRRVTSAGVITTVLGDGVPASSGEGTPAQAFPVDSPRGLMCDGFGNLYVTSSTTVRLLVATDAGVVDGMGAVQTIYGKPPRDMYPASVTTCLTGLAVSGPASVQIADACTGVFFELDRH